jgi:hypothetical protein
MPFRGPNNRTLQSRLEQYSIPEPNSGCWLWIGADDGHGYGQLNIGGKVIKAHRAAWELKVGPIPSGLNVCHKCDTPPCINPDHLFLGTRGENIRDAFAKGRINRAGAAHPQVKLTQQDISNILSCNASNAQIARAYGVTRQHVSGIRIGKTWKGNQ